MQSFRLPLVKPIKTRLTKCTFHKFGSSGELEKHDALCILPINIFNEKIYIFLWFWMLILGALTALVVIYRFALCISSSLRTYLFKLRYRKLVHLTCLLDPPLRICSVCVEINACLLPCVCKNVVH